MRTVLSVLLGILATVCLAVPVWAVPQPPNAFYGNVIVNGSPAANGLTIKAEINGVEYASTTTSGGQYGVQPWFTVPSDDAETPEKEGGVNGDIVKFSIGGVKADQEGIYQWGLRVNLNLTFTIPTTSPPPVGGGGTGGGFIPAPVLKLNLFGNASTLPITSNGVLSEAIQASSQDGTMVISISKGTIALDKEGKPLESLGAIASSVRPAPPPYSSIIGMAYDFAPSGAAFNPPVTLRYKYNLADIPAGASETDLALAYFDTQASKWTRLDSTVDIKEHIITANVSHFTTFAAIAYGKPPAPAAFALSNLVIQPAQVKSSETVTIKATVTNIGEVEGTYSLILQIEGVKESPKSITVAAGKSQDVTFNIDRDKAGVYRVILDNLSGQFTVVAPPAESTSTTPPSTASPPAAPTATAPPEKGLDIDWVKIGGIATGIIVVVTLIFAVAKRSSQKR